MVAAEGEPAALTESRRLRQAAERDRLDAELALRQARETSAAVRQRAQELELRVLRQRLAQHEPRLLFLQQRIRVATYRRRIDRCVAEAAAHGVEDGFACAHWPFS